MGIKSNTRKLVPCIIHLTHELPCWNLPLDLFLELKKRWPQVEFILANNEKELLQNISAAEIFFGWKLNSTSLCQAYQLRWIQLAASGTDKRIPNDINITKIKLTTMAGAGSVAAAEYVLGMILSISHKLFESYDHFKKGEWRRYEVLNNEFLPIHEASEQTVLILGMGSIGSKTGGLLRSIGFRVLGGVREKRDPDEYADEYYSLDSWHLAYPQADFLVLALSLNHQTNGIISDTVLASLPSNCFIINLAREELFNRKALINSLKQKQLRGASIDVLAQEPPIPGQDFPWNIPGLIVTPHIAASSGRYWQRALKIFEKNLETYLQGRV